MLGQVILLVMAELDPAIHAKFELVEAPYGPRGRARGVTTEIAALAASYLIACGLIGEPVPPVMMSGGPQKKNS
jgi:hypothetical protein